MLLWRPRPTLGLPVDAIMCLGSFKQGRVLSRQAPTGCWLDGEDTGRRRQSPEAMAGPGQRQSTVYLVNPRVKGAGTEKQIPIGGGEAGAGRWAKEAAFQSRNHRYCVKSIRRRWKCSI